MQISTIYNISQSETRWFQAFQITDNVFKNIGLWVGDWTALKPIIKWKEILITQMQKYFMSSAQDLHNEQGLMTESMACFANEVWCEVRHGHFASYYLHLLLWQKGTVPVSSCDRGHVQKPKHLECALYISKSLNPCSRRCWKVKLCLLVTTSSIEGTSYTDCKQKWKVTMSSFWIN